LEPEIKLEGNGHHKIAVTGNFLKNEDGMKAQTPNNETNGDANA